MTLAGAGCLALIGAAVVAWNHQTNSQHNPLAIPHAHTAPIHQGNHTTFGGDAQLWKPRLTPPTSSAQSVSLPQAQALARFQVLYPTAVVDGASPEKVWFVPFKDDSGQPADAVLIEYPQAEIVMQQDTTVTDPKAHYTAEAATNADLGATTTTILGQTTYVLPGNRAAGHTGMVEFTLNHVDFLIRGHLPTSDLVTMAKSLTAVAPAQPAGQ